MYDGIATLISYGAATYDEYGNEVITETTTDVYVQPRGVYQSEFYNASQLGLKPSLTLFIANKADYNDQKVVSYNGKRYNVIRADWTAQRDGISLICEERVNKYVAPTTASTSSTSSSTQLESELGGNNGH